MSRDPIARFDRFRFAFATLALSAVLSGSANDAFAFGSAPPSTEPQPTSTPKPTSTATPKPTPTATSTPKPTPTATLTPPPSGGSGAFMERIERIASGSSCAAYKWKDRSRAPAGYMKGMALSFGRSVCRLSGKASLATPAQLMARAITSSATKDAIAHYESIFDRLKLMIDVSGAETLRSLYTLGIGLGMRESSGKYCEGWDASAGSGRPSSEAEAGLFQASYNSMAASSELRKLYDEYRADPGRCLLAQYKEGVSCKSQSILGSGAGAEYQKFAKSCPAFATEYTMALLRVLRKHFGPINRREAEVIQSCNDMLEDVQRLINEDPRNACAELL